MALTGRCDGKSQRAGSKSCRRPEVAANEILSIMRYYAGIMHGPHGMAVSRHSKAKVGKNYEYQLLEGTWVQLQLRLGWLALPGCWRWSKQIKIKTTGTNGIGNQPSYGDDIRSNPVLRSVSNLG